MTEVMMAKRWSQLKVVEPQEWKRHVTRRHAMSMGYSVDWKRLECPGPYLRFSLHRGDRVMRCFIDIHHWTSTHMPEMEGWAWSACDAHAANLFFSGYNNPLTLLDVNADYSYGLFEGLVTSAALVGASDHWPCLWAREGAVWLEDLEWIADQEASTLPGELQLSVKLRAGVVNLRRRQMKAIGAGDVILLGRVETDAMIGDAKVFSFQIDTKELVVVNDIFEGFTDPSAEREEPPAPPMQSTSLNIAALPLTVEVVLCELTYTVSQLAQINKGAAIALPEHAHRTVKLYLQGACIGSGELVQVGQGLGVQLDKALAVS